MDLGWKTMCGVELEDRVHSGAGELSVELVWRAMSGRLLEDCVE